MDSDVPKPTIPFFQYLILPHLLLAIVISIYPNLLWRLSAAILIFSSNIYAAKTYTAGGPYNDYMAGIFLGSMALSAAHLLLIADPLKDYRRERDGVEFASSGLSLLKRVYGLVCVQLNPHNIAWNSQVGALRPIPIDTYSQ